MRELPGHDEPFEPAPDSREVDWSTGFDVPEQPDSLGDVMLRTGEVSLLELAVARQEQRRTGERMGRVLANMGVVHPRTIGTTLAVLDGVPFLDGPLPDPEDGALDAIDLDRARRLIAAPLRIRDGVLSVAVPDPGDDAHLAELAASVDDGVEIEPIVATERAIRESLRVHQRDIDSRASVAALFEQAPEQSARHVLARGQRIVFSLMLLATLALLIWNWRTTVIVGFCASMVLYAVITVFRAAAAVASLRAANERGGPDAHVPEPVADEDLPTYTILVPLYDEAAIVPQLVAGLAKLDYPVSLLDVKLLLEEDDEATIAAARSLRLPSFVDIVLVPYSEPRTKPKSCNYGLRYARGEYIVIYDAEDIPEPDQLRRIVARFRTLPDDVVCIQAHLNYFNRDQNLLTRWFTGEYSGWFDLVVPGLDRMGLPFPLGGTSNHFLTSALVEVGAWDPFNVTEDADLGIRLAARGYGSTVIDSTTYEEANAETFNWIRQRSRWVKGYIQTWLVHMRSPIGFARAVGLKDFLGFNLTVGGTALVFLLNPIQWAVLLTWILTAAADVRSLLPGAVYYLAWTSFLLGNTVFIATNLVAVMRRGYWSLVPSALLAPLYWALMSIAAWRGLIQLLWAPSYWEKTEHGLDRREDDVAGIVPVREQLEATAT